MPLGMLKYIFANKLSRKVKATCSVLTLSMPLSSYLNCNYSVLRLWRVGNNINTVVNQLLTSALMDLQDFGT